VDNEIELLASLGITLFCIYCVKFIWLQKRSTTPQCTTLSPL